MPKALPSRVKAALRAVEKAGKQPAEVVFDADGAIRIVLAPETLQTKKWSLE